MTVAGGTLTGFGTIGGDLLNNAGTVRPGGSIGTLTVNGNYTQSSNGALAIEVSPTAASQLKVGGAATLGGRLALLYDPGVYDSGLSHRAGRRRRTGLSGGAARDLQMVS